MDKLDKLKQEIKDELKKKAIPEKPKPEPEEPSKRDRAKKHRIIRGGGY